MRRIYALEGRFRFCRPKRTEDHSEPAIRRSLREVIDMAKCGLYGRACSIGEMLMKRKGGYGVQILYSSVLVGRIHRTVRFFTGFNAGDIT